MKADREALSLIDTYFENAQVLTYAKGQNVLRPEDIPYGVYYLKEGYIRQYLLSSSGEMFIVHIYKPGSFFPLSWIVNDAPNLFYFEAMTRVMVARSQKEPFVKFLHSTPKVLYYTAQKLAAGMYGLVSRVGQLVLDDAYTKTVLLLLYFADTFGKKTSAGVELSVPLTHREIASWIGTTRETASLQMEGLIKKGFVKMRGRQIILTNLEKLRASSTH